jgi:hypothetical protein
VGTWNAECGIWKAEIFICGCIGLRIEKNKIDLIPVTNQPINFSTNQLIFIQPIN